MSALKATIRPASEVGELETMWRGLEEKSDRSFFLSWDWAACALSLAGPRMQAVVVTSLADEVVALGLLAPVTEQRHIIFRARQLRLNETGPGPVESVFGEFTTLLAAPEMQFPAWDAVMQALNERGAPQWDEIVITNGLLDLEQHLIDRGHMVYRRAEHGSAYVDLEALRIRGVETAADYIATLGKSTRSQINRSMKLYKERGPLLLERASTVAEGHAYLAEIGDAQKQKWQARTINKDAVIDRHMKFHRELINRTLEHGGVELARLSSGDIPFAWVYNFIDRGHVLFDGGGFKVETDNRLKPGLVAHALLIEDHLKSGNKIYDFLAGDDRYKRNLGQAGPEFVGFAVQRSTLALRAENALRAIKYKFFADEKA